MRKSSALLQIPIKPRQRSFQCIDAMLRLAQPVSLSRIPHQNSLNSAALQRHVHLFRLRDVNVVVLLAMNEQRRRLRLFDVSQRRPLPEQIVIVPGKAAKLRMNQILVKRSGIEADQIADARCWQRQL